MVFIFSHLRSVIPVVVRAEGAFFSRINCFSRAYMHVSLAFHPSIPLTIQKRTKLVGGVGMVDPPERLKLGMVEERVLKAIKSWDRFPQDKTSALKLDSQFAQDLSLDSLDMVEVIISVEDEFQLEVSEADLDSFKTPRDFVNYVCDNLPVKK